MYFWNRGEKQTKIQEYCDLSEYFVNKLVKYLRERIKKYFQINPFIFCGPEKLIQTDETVLNYKVRHVETECQKTFMDF